MKPYYDDGTCVIYHGDCREILPGLTDIGLIVTSPPYNLDDEGRAGDGTQFVKLVNGYEGRADALSHSEYVAWQQAVLTECWETLSDDGAIFYNHKPRVRGNDVWLPLELLPDWMPLRQIVVWDRTSGFNRQATYFIPTYEWVMLIARPSFRLASRSAGNDVWRVPYERGPDHRDEHPAPFPLALAVKAIAATDADMILDPFMGSGTTLRAAKDLNRRAIGIEIEERYCEIAARRLAQEVLPLNASGQEKP